MARYGSHPRTGSGPGYSPAFSESVDLGIRKTYADLGKTIMDNFDLTGLQFGTSFLTELR